MFSEAVTEGLKALGEAEKTAGPDSPEAASTLGLLATVAQLGQYDEAGPYYLRALAIHEARNGPNHPDTASTLNNLAQLRHFQARYGNPKPSTSGCRILRKGPREGRSGPCHDAEQPAELYRSQGNAAAPSPCSSGPWRSTRNTSARTTPTWPCA